MKECEPPLLLISTVITIAIHNLKHEIHDGNRRIQEDELHPQNLTPHQDTPRQCLLALTMTDNINSTNLDIHIIYDEKEMSYYVRL